MSTLRRLAKGTQKANEGNLEHWEDLAAFHGTGNDRYYDVAALLSAQTSLCGLEADALDLATRGADAAGLDIAHVPSHIGIDSIHLARMGANVTADAASHDRFDVVYATVGVISWIADLGAWMRGAAALLRPGGRLALLELHPLLWMPETTAPLVMDFPYVNDGVRHYEGTGSYANPYADLSWSIDQYAWSIGETVNAALDAGLGIVRLVEHVESPYDPRGDILVREDDGMFRLRIGRGRDGRAGEPLPLLFTLVAEGVR